MITDETFDRDLGDWLRSEAAVSAPTDLHRRAIEQADGSRPRPGWLVAVRGDAFGRSRSGWRPRSTRIATLVVVGALVWLVAAIAIGVGRRPAVVPVVPNAPSASPTDGSPEPAPSVTPPTAGVPGWSAATDMLEPREDATAIALPDGTVLVAGGSGFGRSSAELYDPRSGTWTRTARMLESRRHHAATLLSDGRVLVTGGGGTGGVEGLASAEVYGTTSRAWTWAGDMTTPRLDATATLLTDGSVLVVGGATGDDSGFGLSSAELWDPTRDPSAAGVWRPTGSLRHARSNHTATLLPDGRVLVVGGDDGISGESIASAELYDPATGTWTGTREMSEGRAAATATLLSDGTVLVIGGNCGSASHDLWSPEARGTAEIYHPDDGTWSKVADLALEPRGDHTATVLSGGRVLIAGGNGCGTHTNGLSNGPLTSSEVYDPGRGTWADAGTMRDRREGHTASLLPDGTVLVAGGYELGGIDGVLFSVDRYTP